MRNADSPRFGESAHAQIARLLGFRFLILRIWHRRRILIFGDSLFLCGLFLNSGRLAVLFDRLLCGIDRFVGLFLAAAADEEQGQTQAGQDREQLLHANILSSGKNREPTRA